MVIALPGAGKTKMLATKAARILSDNKSKVAAVTFTRDSAHELRERILLIAGLSVLPRLIVGTYHSVDLLMAFPNRAKIGGMGSSILAGRTTPFKDPWVLIPEGNRKSFIARAIIDSGLDIEFEDAVKYLESAKGDPKTANTPQKQKLVSTYTALLSRHGSIDFQDIILKTNSALSNGSLLPLAVTDLLLDEFQDTDKHQLEWAGYHGKANVKITAVGDDDQSIYAFRKALGFTGITLFKDRFKAQQVVLGTNYRSHQEILTSATHLIRNNQSRVDKDADAQKGPGGTVEWEGFSTRNLESAACAETANDAVTNGSSFAVLSRTSSRLDEIEASLILLGTPFIRSEGESVLDHREYVLFAGIIESLYKPSPKTVDEVMAWCRLPEKDVAILHRLANGLVQPLNATLMIKNELETDSRSTWNKFARFHADWKEAAMADYAMSSLVIRLGIHEFLASYTSDKRALSRLELIQRMFECYASDGLKERLAFLNSAKLAEKKKTIENKVNLMTAHGSKGLEFDGVWIIGAEDGSFPHKDSMLDEERRLFYVAMTRARKSLYISKSGAKPPSAFITEAQVTRAPMGKYKTSNEAK